MTPHLPFWPHLNEANIVVTGASSGIGREIARELAVRARSLVLVARRRDRLEALRDELVAERATLKVAVKPVDLVDLTAAGRMVDEIEAELGPVDSLINNAGFGDLSLFEYSSWEKLEKMIAVNITALSYLTRRVVPGMVARGRGGILNVSSGFGLVFMPGFSTYAATKHYVTAFTEALRIELKSTGVRVSQLCPGPVATEFLEVAENPLQRTPPKLLEVTAKRCARVAVRGFGRGKALIVPGFWMRMVLWLGRLTPRFLSRLVFRGMARMFRGKQGPEVANSGQMG